MKQRPQLVCRIYAHPTAKEPRYCFARCQTQCERVRLTERFDRVTPYSATLAFIFGFVLAFTT